MLLSMLRDGRLHLSGIRRVAPHLTRENRTDPTPKSRHIPAAVRRTVYERDVGRCAYVNGQGRRCQTRERLEFHHDGTLYARGGDHSPENIRLMCRVHNALLAEQEYGKEKMARHRLSKSHGSKPVAVRSIGSAALVPGPQSAAGKQKSPARARAPSPAP